MSSLNEAANELRVVERRTDVSAYEPGNAIAVFALFLDAAEYKAWKCYGPQYVITPHADGYAIRKLMPV